MQRETNHVLKSILLCALQTKLYAVSYVFKYILVYIYMYIYLLGICCFPISLQGGTGDPRQNVSRKLLPLFLWIEHSTESWQQCSFLCIMGLCTICMPLEEVDILFENSGM